MSDTVSAARALLRISVQSEGRRVDIGVPAQLPLVELMPGLARNLGVLDPTMVHAGYALQRTDGSILDASRGAAAQGVSDGELLTLSRGKNIAQPRVYDDIVEAVIDATSSQHQEWTPKDGARTALATSLALLGICAILLVVAGPTPLTAVIAGGGSIVLLAVAAVIARLDQPAAGSGIALAAAAFGGIAGYLAVPTATTPWGWPVAAAGAGAVIIGGIAFALTPERPEWQLIPLAAGAALGIAGMVSALLPTATVGAYALLVALVGTLGNTLPWLALSSTRIKAISPQSDTDVFAMPQPINSSDISKRVESGLRVLISMRIAFGMAAITGTVVAASANPAGAILCALTFVGMMFPARQSYQRTGVIALMTLSTIGLVVTGVAVTIAQPELRTALLIALIIIVAIVIAIALLAPKPRTRLARIADIAEVVIIAVLLPISVIAAGWV